MLGRATDERAGSKAYAPALPASLNTAPVSAASDPALGFRLYEALRREPAATSDLMLTTGQRSATERVVGFLLAFSRRNDRDGQDPTSKHH